MNGKTKTYSVLLRLFTLGYGLRLKKQLSIDN